MEDNLNLPHRPGLQVAAAVPAAEVQKNVIRCPSSLLFSGALRQVRSAVCLSREASGRPLVETVPGEEALALQEADSGAMRLRAGEPFSEEMSALWLGVQSLAFTLVCEAHENLLLAEGTLRNLSRHCLEQLHMLGQGSEVSRAVGS